ncbi:MAG: hypothetical protein KVP17_004241 [Porospora cf. gigantea B]|uniref:uncharacterized protein n=1 Tax=Porospora cf. gigantea B TaxID=2853592 RepID=UPI003571AFD2|nr:MAG: hypothetical protein KVP17_004241 [Porospora cf. gigantea B]
MHLLEVALLLLWRAVAEEEEGILDFLFDPKILPCSECTKLMAEFVEDCLTQVEAEEPPESETVKLHESVGGMRVPK